MFLEKLDIQGFKSFANKNTLTFPAGAHDKKGITVIVGPNGSGKSNIADAVRWVLGEQSMKTIRAKSSEDVIFSGSSSKGQLGMAEVSLYLNNEDGQAPIDYSQLVITRRIYRSGESDYLLNEAKVRLVDIQILLARASIGQKTYSVIGQGMVESFLATTASERKEFFDEATGVRQFQIKREQSLSKLISSYENLGQANMLLAEIEPRLKSLTRQVNKLRARDEIETELKKIRTTYFKFVWHNLNDKFTEYNNKYLNRDEIMRAKTGELARLNEELAKMEENRESEEYEKLSSSAGEIQRQREEILKKIAAADAQMSLALEAHGNFDLSWLINKESELKQELEKIDAASNKLKQELEGKKNLVNNFNEEKKNLNNKIEELNKTLRDLAGNQKGVARDDKKINSLLSEIKIELEKIETENDLNKIKESLSKLKSLISEVINLSSAGDDRETFFARQREIQEELLKFAREKEELLGRAAEPELAAKTLEEKIILLNENFRQKKNEFAATTEKIKSSGENKSSDDLKDKKEQLEIELREIDGRVREIQDQLGAFNREREEKRAKLFRLQREGQNLQQEINGLSNELNVLKIDSAKYETRLEDLETEIRKAASDLKDIKENRANEEVNTLEAEIKIRQLENQLNLIGGIDPEVEKEFNETKTKFDFLKEQTDDLSSAIGTLEGVIKELDGKIKERFDHEFKEISRKFEEYFKILFSGGSAKIIKLEDEAGVAAAEGATPEEKSEQDELQEKIKRLSKFNATGLAGIEIQACPPGKKISSINMLSGGEKALTAIALICAIISANPSPFVFLDEVDAALDESNSERLAKILEDLSSKTQFIVITHNRAPMHRASVLYGVTMQENGVSKLLSIKLEDYIKK
ncbi:MAG TPA: AAA family ATPase [Candidatus Methylomirabilis sp.]|nr:AAA family ATPase [Candidatus Methylomirabilis sp.]